MTYEDLIQPTGRLTADQFPGDDPEALAARLTAYLGERTGTDALKKAWAEYRAYDAIAQRLAVEPNLSIPNAVGISYGSGMLAHFAALAKECLATYEALAAAEATPSPVRRVPASSSTSPIQFGW